MTDQTITDVLYLIDAWERGAYADEYPNEIEALRQALAQPEQIETLDRTGKWLTIVYKDVQAGDEARQIIEHPKMSAASWSNALNDRDVALAQPEQEPFNRLIRIMGTFDLATGHADGWDDLLESLESELRDVLGHYREALKEKNT